MTASKTEEAPHHLTNQVAHRHPSTLNFQPSTHPLIIRHSLAAFPLPTESPLHPRSSPSAPESRECLPGGDAGGGAAGPRPPAGVFSFVLEPADVRLGGGGGPTGFGAS